MYSEDRVIISTSSGEEVAFNGTVAEFNDVLESVNAGSSYIEYEKSCNLSNSSRIGRENTTFSRENHHSNKNNCMEDEPKVAEREVQTVTGGEQLFPDEIDIATSNGEQYRLDSALAKDLHDLAELDKLLEIRSKLEERVRTGIEDFMKELRLSDLKTFYYDFYLSIKRGNSKIDERRLREEKEDIYNYYMKLAEDKYKLALFRNSAVLSGSNVTINKKQEAENGNK